MPSATHLVAHRLEGVGEEEVIKSLYPPTSKGGGRGGGGKGTKIIFASGFSAFIHEGGRTAVSLLHHV